MIDGHTHLDTLRCDPHEAIVRARDAGVTGVVTVGCGIDSTRTVIALAREYPGYVRVAAGVHPQQASRFDLATWDEFVAVVEDALDVVCAIGETGFDQYRDYGSIEQQAPVFELQCGLARQHGLPLVIHTRAAEEATLDALQRHAHDLTVVLHCFSLPGHLDVVTERDYYASFAGNMTYPSAGDLREAVAALPADRLLVETDAPYLAPVPHRGSPNEPAFVRSTLEVLARVRGIDLGEAERITDDNAARVYGFAPVGAA